MQIEVDQSGRVEWTQKPTVLALANGMRFSIQISAREKRVVHQQLNRQKPQWSKNLAKVYVFSVLLYLLLRDHIGKLDMVIIDAEFTGYDAVIKNRLLTMFRKQGMQVFADQITFRQIGKQSPAHKTTIAVFRGKTKPDRQITAEEVLAEF